jgi:cell division protein ZapD
MTVTRSNRCDGQSGGSPTSSGYDESPANYRLLQTSAAVILYEYPFNERIRTYLRLEHLFRRLAELLPRNHPLDHHYAIQTIFEIMDVASRADMKSDVLKDIERHKQQLNSYRGNPAISERALDEVIAQLDTCFAQLNNLPGKTGLSLTENDWLMSIRSRIGIPGGTCEFDLPAYFHWQHHSVEQRQADLQRWVQALAPLAEAIVLLLKMLRDSGSPQKVVAPDGQFQQNLPQGRTFQLLRLGIDPTLGLIPEISGNRLLLSVRLMRLGDDERLHLAQEDVSFELTLCA